MLISQNQFSIFISRFVCFSFVFLTITKVPDTSFHRLTSCGVPSLLSYLCNCFLNLSWGLCTYWHWASLGQSTKAKFWEHFVSRFCRKLPLPVTSWRTGGSKKRSAGHLLPSPGSAGPSVFLDSDLLHQDLCLAGCGRLTSEMSVGFSATFSGLRIVSHQIRHRVLQVIT